jgi:F-box and leucine-rich repeat protein GRR1
LTDLAVNAIAKLGKNLHYLHLGHCGHITDNAVIKLVSSCNRIRYIDLGCCVHLTDLSVMKLAQLPKLRRIGLVKCSNITDESVYALAHAQRPRHRVVGEHGQEIASYYPGSSLERVHLSYCTNLTLKSVVVLLNQCHKLTHLSLTGVQAFLRNDLEAFCREAPPGKLFHASPFLILLMSRIEFTEHQRNVFCVFSGVGVSRLRDHLNQYEHPAMRDDDEDDFDQQTMAGDDQNMTGMMAAPHSISIVNVDDDEDADGDEELEDGEGS